MKRKDNLLFLALASSALASQGIARQGCPISVDCPPAGVLHSTSPETDSYGPATLPFGPLTLTVDQFDPAFYANLHGVSVSQIALKGIEFEATTVVQEMVASFHNMNVANGCNLTWQYDIATEVLANPALGTPAFPALAVQGEAVQLGPGSGSSPPPWQYEWLLSQNGGPITQADCFGETAPASLPAWTGNGTLDFTIDSSSSEVDNSNCGSLVKAYDNLASVSITVTYSYCILLPGPGTLFCVGDPGVGTPCPCGDNDGSVPGSGCNNGVFTSGARLTGSGVPSVGADSLVLTATHQEPNHFGLFFQGDNSVAGGDGSPFGDGLLCASGNQVRLQVLLSDLAGTSSTTIPLGAKGGVGAGEVKRYQCWYRTKVNPPCGVGVNDFNLSNGYELVWLP